MIPKVDNADQVRRIDRCINEHGLEDTKDSLKIIASVESPLSLLNLREVSFPESAAIEATAELMIVPCLLQIATSSKRLDSLLFAAEDYCASSSITRTPSRVEMLFARSSVVTHAKAFGLNAIDLVRTSYKGPEAVEGLKEEAEEGRRLGFDGKVRSAALLFLLLGLTLLIYSKQSTLLKCQPFKRLSHPLTKVRLHKGAEVHGLSLL